MSGTQQEVLNKFGADRSETLAGQGSAPLLSKCQFQTCTKPSFAKQLCQGHYAQHHRGTPLHPLSALRNPAHPRIPIRKLLDRKIRPEYRTVMNHWMSIFRLSHLPAYRTYRGMPFETSWDTRKGGSFLVGMYWIITHLGYRIDWAAKHHIPERRVSLHIKNHARGFTKGNLKWATPQIQSAGKMRAIIARQEIKIQKLQAKLRRIPWST